MDLKEDHIAPIYLSKTYIIMEQLARGHDVIALPELPSEVGKSNPQTGFHTPPGSAGFHQGGVGPQVKALSACMIENPA